MDEKLAEEARQYYEHALVDVLESLSDSFNSVGTVINEFYKTYISASDAERLIHNIFLHLTIKKFIADEIVDDVSDAFSPPFIKISDTVRKIGFSNSVSQKCEKLGDSQAIWLASAFNAIAKRFKHPELLAYYKSLVAEMERTSGQAASTANDAKIIQESSGDPADTWEPIKIDRTSAEYAQAVDASEAALREIESSNGYASSAPEERNAIVASIKGTLEATKEGSPSKSAIVAGLIRPLEYIAKKFSDVTMGEIAKIAVSKVWALLNSLMG